MFVVQIVRPMVMVNVTLETKDLKIEKKTNLPPTLCNKGGYFDNEVRDKRSLSYENFER